MAYTKNTWANGDVITADKLNHLENGVEAADTGGGLTDDIRAALIQLAAKVAYIDDDGAEYYGDLYDALYAVQSIYLNTNSILINTIGGTSQLTATTSPSGATVSWSSSDSSVATVSSSGLVTSVALGSCTITATAGSKTATCSVTVAQKTLSSISAVYIQSGTVYTNTSLDSLKSDLVVTAHWSDNTTSTVSSEDYTLSGTLTAGTSTVTVSYGGKTTTFNVTVTAVPTLSSITAVYTQSGTVYDTDSLDSLKADLVVTAHYSDSSSSTVAAADYTLSGTLATGTSTITVTYQSKTTTFAVTVTHATPTYVTDGLIFRIDGIENTENGHDSSATTWEDLAGTYDLTTITNGTWTNNSLSFSANVAQIVSSQGTYNAPANSTIEVVLNIKETGTQIIGAFGTQDSTVSQRIVVYSDNTVGFVGTPGYTYSNSEASLTDIHTMVVTYSGYTVNKAYINNTQLSLSNNTHSFRRNQNNKIIVLANADQTDGTKYPLNGEIMAVRIYNRELTDAEITQNHSVDVERFELE